jgi:hypothetical protein
MHATPDEEFADPPLYRQPPSKIPLHDLVLFITVAGMGMFTWHRTSGDLVLSLVVAIMTAAVIEVKVSKSQVH